MAERPENLIPGYAHIDRGMARYRGALRESPGGRPAWTCQHDHAYTGGAVMCAKREKNGRVEAGKVVLDVLWCEHCTTWTPYEEGVTACWRCYVPVDRVKLLILERHPA